MGMDGHLTFLVLLLTFHCPGSFAAGPDLSLVHGRLPLPALLGLPHTVTVSEDTAPGTAVAEVTLLCSNGSSNPRVMLVRVEPRSPSDPNATLLGPFNPVAVSSNGSLAYTFQAEITLSAGAALDVRWVNQYTLTLRAACHGEEEAEGQLFVRVTPVQTLRCAASFASTEGDTVQVLADVAPQTLLYTVVPFQTARELTFYLKNNDTPLVLSERGTVLAPASGFDPRPSTQVFRLEIVVMDRHGHNCSGAVTVEVLPSRRPQINFTESWRDVAVPEGIGPLELVTQVHASGDKVRYVLLNPAAPALFTVDAVSGEIRSTRRLDLERFPQAAHTQLLVQAYEARAPIAPAPMHLNITLDRLLPLRCAGPTGPDGALHYAVEGAAASHSLFRMEGPQLQVNTTLDYDSELAAAVGFQFAVTIVVTAGGQPPRSTRVPVLVTVTPVNEYAPQCPNSTAFTVPETAAFGTVVGSITGTDRDYPLHSIEYSLEERVGSAQPFSVDTRMGERGPPPEAQLGSSAPMGAQQLGTTLAGKIYVVGTLDYERQKSYRLVVRLTDTHNDADPAKRRSCLCNVAVHVQAVLGEAPVCTPEVQELRVTSKAAQPVTRLACQGSSEGAPLSYAIIRGEELQQRGGASCPGNEDRHFRVEGNTLLHVPNGLDQPRTFVLLVEVWGGPGVPRRSTTVMLVVHVTPQPTTVPPWSTAWRSTPRKEPVIITRTEATWSPPAWFVVALTASGALLLAALGCAAHALLLSARGRSKLLRGT
ncbi:PREDICTED: LOW QUALITY PROTEIN: cadherin-related family member 4, partial [Tinamus guttatus]|uniref:LOW QUALITY PROTEIN: cadherin-related family member 4 n=1 Tax=Tinamus guttatus TaxID=94827 RepID=UPI00052EF509